MQEVLTKAPPGSRVLDLGSGGGSFDARPYGLSVVRADLDPPKSSGRGGVPVACAAWALPFRDGAFAALILNHSLEHFEQLDECIREMARVLAPDGLLYIAVPDASTITDRIYRWLGRGGGHVNPFRNSAALAGKISDLTGLPHAGTRTLVSSFSFLNRRNMRSRPPRKLWLLGNGHEGVLRWASWLLRLVDRRFRSRTSVYGWALYFGDVQIVKETWSNACVGCGSGHPGAALKQMGAVRERRWRPSLYRCPHCGARNYFTEDR
jgi:SAM-dependent methyltransferase